MRIRVVSQARLLVFVLLLSTLLILGGWLVGARSSAYAGQAQLADVAALHGPHVVAPGDTLWDIAATYAPRQMDLRFAVYSLRERNALASANLLVGQRIELPASWVR